LSSGYVALGSDKPQRLAKAGDLVGRRLARHHYALGRVPSDHAVADAHAIALRQNSLVRRTRSSAGC
jgi:hypothetical protein